MRRIMPALLVAALAGCEPAPLDIELRGGDIVFHSILVAGRSDVTAALSRMPEPASHSNQPLIGVPILDAVVEIGHGANTWVLTYAPVGHRCRRLGWTDDSEIQPCYTGDIPGGVQAGATYTLRVSLADGRVVTGSTTVPPPPRITHPAAGVTVHSRRPSSSGPATPLMVRWDPLPASLHSELLLVPDVEGCVTTLPDGSGFGLSHTISRESEVELMPITGCRFDLEGDPIPAHIVAATYDANFSRYREHVSRARSVFATEAAMGISGAFGVFGATAAHRVPVTLELR